jgi:hypothetical protein
MIHFFKVCTGCLLCRVPELGSYCGTSWRMRDFYAIRLPVQEHRFCFTGCPLPGSSFSECVSFLCLHSVYSCVIINMRINIVELGYNVIKGTEYFVSL